MKRSSPPHYPLVPLLLCLALFSLIYFGDTHLQNGLTNFTTALAYDQTWTEVFSNLGRSLTVGEETEAVFSKKTSVSPFLPPSPALTPSPTPTLSQVSPASTPASSGVFPSQTPSPTPSSRPYSGPAMPAGATMEYLDLGLESTENPTNGGYTSLFGWRTHPLTGQQTFHDGVDISAAESTDVLAFADGKILAANWEDSYGYYIKIEHSDRVSTFYAHCSQLLKQPGDTVKKGEVIAKSGSTGHVTGPHLHFEIRVEDTLCNPTYYLTLS